MTIRPLRLAQIATEAETLRLRGLASRIVTRLVFAIIALIFFLGALTFAHVAAWDVIRGRWDQTPLITAALLGGIDVAVALVLILLASRSRPGRTEREALVIRRQAVDSLRGMASLTQMALPLLSVVRFAARLQRRRRP